MLTLLQRKWDMKVNLNKIYNNEFAEIFQQNKTKFAFAKQTSPKEYKQQHGLVKCRDFLCDVLQAEEQNAPFAIYNFSWDPKIDRIDRDSIKLYIKFESAEEKKTLKRNLSTLHTIEKNQKLKRTRVLDVSNTEAIIIGSSLWLKKGWAISLYTFILKCLTVSYDFTELPRNEQCYLEDAGNNFYKLIRNIRKMLRIKGNVSGVNDGSPSMIHNYAGFVSVCSGNNYNHYSKHLDKLK